MGPVSGPSMHLFCHSASAQKSQKKLKCLVVSEQFEHIISFTAQSAEFVIFIWKLILTWYSTIKTVSAFSTTFVFGPEANSWGKIAGIICFWIFCFVVHLFSKHSEMHNFWRDYYFWAVLVPEVPAWYLLQLLGSDRRLILGRRSLNMPSLGVNTGEKRGKSMLNRYFLDFKNS